MVATKTVDMWLPAFMLSWDSSFRLICASPPPQAVPFSEELLRISSQLHKCHIFYAFFCNTPGAKLVSSFHSTCRVPLTVFWNMFTGLSHWQWAQQGLDCVLTFIAGSTVEWLVGSTEEAGEQSMSSGGFTDFIGDRLSVCGPGWSWTSHLPASPPKLTVMSPARLYDLLFVWPWPSKNSREAHFPPIENGDDDTALGKCCENFDE